MSCCPTLFRTTPTISNVLNSDPILTESKKENPPIELSKANDTQQPSSAADTKTAASKLREFGDARGRPKNLHLAPHGAILGDEIRATHRMTNDDHMLTNDDHMRTPVSPTGGSTNNHMRTPVSPTGGTQAQIKSSEQTEKEQTELLKPPVLTETRFGLSSVVDSEIFVDTGSGIDPIQETAHFARSVVESQDNPIANARPTIPEKAMVESSAPEIRLSNSKQDNFDALPVVDSEIFVDTGSGIDALQETGYLARPVVESQDDSIANARPTISEKAMGASSAPEILTMSFGQENRVSNSENVNPKQDEDQREIAHFGVATAKEIGDAFTSSDPKKIDSFCKSILNDLNNEEFDEAGAVFLLKAVDADGASGLQRAIGAGRLGEPNPAVQQFIDSVNSMQGLSDESKAAVTHLSIVDQARLWLQRNWPF